MDYRSSMEGQLAAAAAHPQQQQHHDYKQHENNTASDSESSDGGGIYNLNQLTIDERRPSATIRGSDDGGTIRGKTLTITNSTLSGNRAQSGSGNFSGGGANPQHTILQQQPSAASTISGNSAKESASNSQRWHLAPTSAYRQYELS
jgi:hypothetical protein